MHTKTSLVFSIIAIAGAVSWFAAGAVVATHQAWACDGWGGWAVAGDALPTVAGAVTPTVALVGASAVASVAGRLLPTKTEKRSNPFYFYTAKLSI